MQVFTVIVQWKFLWGLKLHCASTDCCRPPYLLWGVSSSSCLHITCEQMSTKSDIKVALNCNMGHIAVKTEVALQKIKSVSDFEQSDSKRSDLLCFVVHTHEKKNYLGHIRGKKIWFMPLGPAVCKLSWTELRGQRTDICLHRCSHSLRKKSEAFPKTPNSFLLKLQMS